MAAAYAMVARLDTTSRAAERTRWKRRSGMRWASARVSGSRRVQAAMPSAQIAQSTNSHRHGATSSTAAPMLGASTGTSRKTAMSDDIVRDMASPSKRSRTTARATTLGPAAPTPHSARATSSSGRFGATAARSAPTT